MLQHNLHMKQLTANILGIIEVPDGSVVMASISGTWNALSMIWKVMGSNPGDFELGVHSTSVEVILWIKIYLTGKANWNIWLTEYYKPKWVKTTKLVEHTYSIVSLWQRAIWIWQLANKITWDPNLLHSLTNQSLQHFVFLSLALNFWLRDLSNPPEKL